MNKWIHIKTKTNHISVGQKYMVLSKNVYTQFQLTVQDVLKQDITFIDPKDFIHELSATSLQQAEDEWKIIYILADKG